MKRRKRQTTYWDKKKFENHIFDKGHIRIYKSPKSSIIRKQIKNEKKIWTDPKKKERENKRSHMWLPEMGGGGRGNWVKAVKGPANCKL